MRWLGKGSIVRGLLSEGVRREDVENKEVGKGGRQVHWGSKKRRSR